MITNMKLGFSTNAFTNYSLFDSIELISKIGYDGIEIVLDEPHAFLPLSKNRISEIKNSILEKNLEVSNLNANTVLVGLKIHLKKDLNHHYQIMMKNLESGVLDIQNKLLILLNR